MSEENKTETKAEKKEEVSRGDRGELGTATAGLTIRQQWHEAYHRRVDVGDKHNPHKRAWMRPAGTPSLKQFAREQAKAGNKVALTWFANKLGAGNQKRTEKNQARIQLEKTASKAARRKKSQANQGKAKTDAAAPAAATAGKK